MGESPKGGENGLMDLFGGPAAEGRTGMQENFQQTDDAGVVDLDSGIADRADGEGQGQALQQWKVNVHIEGLGLEGGKAVGNDLESGGHGVEMIEAFLETKVRQMVGTKFIAQVAGKLFVLFEKSVLPVGAEDVMAMFDLIENGGQLSA